MNNKKISIIKSNTVISERNDINDVIHVEDKENINSYIYKKKSKKIKSL